MQNQKHRVRKEQGGVKASISSSLKTSLLRYVSSHPGGCR
jgi:hypothetical protein